MRLKPARLQPVLPVCSAPVGEKEFAAWAAPFAALPRLAVGVSGGSDSLALLLLLARWRQRLSCPPALFALTIDHRLRPESAEEARHAARVSKKLRLPHVILPWRGAAAGSGLQARARAARAKLLADWCARNRAPGLLLAHQLEDQAATFLFRLARGSSPAGLAAMRPVSSPVSSISSQNAAPVKLFRPLLSVPRARLRANLLAEGIVWREDPSNHHPDFARTHLEALLPFLAARGLSPAHLAKAAEGAARLRAALEALAREEILYAQGEARLNIARLLALPQASALFLLRQALMHVGQRAYPPATAACTRLLARLHMDANFDAMLAGCRLQRRGGRLTVQSSVHRAWQSGFSAPYATYRRQACSGAKIMGKWGQARAPLRQF